MISPACTSLSLIIQSCVLDCWVHPDDQQQLAACSGVAPVTVASASGTWCPCALVPTPRHESESTERFALNPLGQCLKPQGLCSALTPITLTWDPFRSTVGSFCCSERDPVCAAAYLHLLGESLCLIGLHLRTTDVS